VVVLSVATTALAAVSLRASGSPLVLHVPMGEHRLLLILRCPRSAASWSSGPHRGLLEHIRPARSATHESSRRSRAAGGFRGVAPRAGITKRQRRASWRLASTLAPGVEVAGIEPASFGIEAGLLRAQPAVLFSAPAITQASRRRAQPLFGFPTGPAAGPAGGVSLRCQIPGRRRSRADKFAYLALSGEGELILRLVGRYWFAAQDLRGCLRSPRPASPCLVMSKSKPVTPLLSCQRPDSAGRSHIIERSQWVARFLGRERENPGGCGWRTHRGDRQGRAGPDGRASPETRLWSHHGD
jgi:hypothetical protein